MKDLLLTLLHLAVTTAKLCGPGGVRAVIAENLLLEQQLIVLCRAEQCALGLPLPLDWPGANGASVKVATLQIHDEFEATDVTRNITRRIPGMPHVARLHVRPATVCKWRSHFVRLLGM